MTGSLFGGDATPVTPSSSRVPPPSIAAGEGTPGTSAFSSGSGEEPSLPPLDRRQRFHDAARSVVLGDATPVTSSSSGVETSAPLNHHRSANCCHGCSCCSQRSVVQKDSPRQKVMAIIALLPSQATMEQRRRFLHDIACCCILKRRSDWLNDDDSEAATAPPLLLCCSTGQQCEKRYRQNQAV
jgi:hypothetical protein